MPIVNIIVNQSGKDPGVAGISRDDLEISAAPIVFTNEVVSALDIINSWKWEIISWPKATVDEAVPSVTGETTDTFSFTPLYAGTYIVKLTINNTIKGTIGAAIKTANLGIRIVGEKETNEFPGGVSYQLIKLLEALELIAGLGGMG